MSDFLPYGRQFIQDDDIAAVTEALKADYLTTGPTVAKFERAFADHVGAPDAVACSNGTAALHLAMMMLGIGEGDVCIVPSITFLATANCVRYCGGEVVFADVDSDSGLMTPQTLEDALKRAGKPVKAVLPVHMRGELCDMPALSQITERQGGRVVEDAAHAVGSRRTFGNQVVHAGDCRHSVMTTFSFHPVKTITTGEGGMITTSSTAVAAELRTLRSHGMVRHPGADPWLYEMDSPGYNYRLPDINCALGLSQLAKLDRLAVRRRELAAYYEQRIAPLAPLIWTAVTAPGSDPCLHLMTVLIDFKAAGTTRRAVVDGLTAAGIGSQVHYIPVHTQPYYRKRYGDLDLPGANAWYEACLSLPLYPQLEKSDIDRIVETLGGLLGIK
ncbi:UDP-4-amino-4,6-dideoxy-N-acetyl-beta-L-altrosamine transaminase [Caulobacter ginsengisoli]|uniref:UDP-4-amino-4, 6-dideoxy-N-acetyl-beta-L-altrosamine transaminase n=1 Tax=Caulobacter ginsengisoli TaxID=400775 RepID=A0ABU0IXD6_9CAUL|nr:UDP-4-amino-4,6-dideoxy-N-acetyl-beta-L-altrosamine transaminase [Caulobacter ginsengisoli]MDQ0465617.1 UDP-4-amino-4,6-dideoxy-N-acetyl-beta-L-altrosamine transaminase [Caulobacter ginsengisoli]